MGKKEGNHHKSDGNVPLYPLLFCFSSEMKMVRDMDKYINDKTIFTSLKRT